MIPLFHIAFSHIFLDEVNSTNDYAIHLIAKSNPKEGTVITTYNQTNGKGQIGRGWFSDENKNISLSVILHPYFLPIKDSFYLSMVAALAVRQTVESYTKSEKVYIKWPNDIFVENKKVAGLLIQQNLQNSKIASCVLGIGLNVNQEDFPSDIPNPISMYQITNIEEDLFDVQQSIQENITLFYNQLRERSFTELKKMYLSYLYKRGEIAEFKNNDNIHFFGEILGIDATGKLMIHSNNKVLSFALHEIRLILD